MTPRVYVPQFPTYRCPRTRLITRKPLDLRDAARYGEVTELVSDTAKPWDPAVLAEVDRALAESSGQDFVLLMGNPTMIALVSAAFAQIHGRLRALQFQRSGNRYEAVEYEFSAVGTRVASLTQPTPPQEETRK